MALEYNIRYQAENNYEHPVQEAHWQFLIIPETNDTQTAVEVVFHNSLGTPHEYSINGYGFRTIRVRFKKPVQNISFEASFTLFKKETNPFDFEPENDIQASFEQLELLPFKVDFEPFLKSTDLTQLFEPHTDLFSFNKTQSIFDNLQNLNSWTFEQLHFKTNVTNVHTQLNEILEKRQGVCQDFTHLFCALARANGVPARYVSGYLHQGNGFFGDSQMHAWAEAFVPAIGWVGFDPTNNLLASSNHIKVAHGKDYQDCAPLRGVVHTIGKNETSHTVQVNSQQQ